MKDQVECAQIRVSAASLTQARPLASEDNVETCVRDGLMQIRLHNQVSLSSQAVGALHMPRKESGHPFMQSEFISV